MDQRLQMSLEDIIQGQLEDTSQMLTSQQNEERADRNRSSYQPPTLRSRYLRKPIKKSWKCNSRRFGFQRQFRNQTRLLKPWLNSNEIFFDRHQGSENELMRYKRASSVGCTPRHLDEMSVHSNCSGRSSFSRYSHASRQSGASEASCNSMASRGIGRGSIRSYAPHHSSHLSLASHDSSYVTETKFSAVLDPVIQAHIKLMKETQAERLSSKSCVSLKSDPAHCQPLVSLTDVTLNFLEMLPKLRSPQSVKQLVHTVFTEFKDSISYLCRRNEAHYLSVQKDLIWKENNKEPSSNND